MNSPDIPNQGTDSFKKTVFATLILLFGAGAAFIGMLGIISMIFGITGIAIRETGEPGKGVRFDMVVPKGAYRFSGNR
jgi:hypothetical protein